MRLQKPGASGRSVANVQRFFSLTLFIHGVHALYLLGGLVFGIAVLARTSLRDSAVFLGLAGVYWLVVGALGLVAAPALYF